MKIPKKLSICGHQYIIKYSSELTYEGKEVWGLIDGAKNIIYLKKGMPPTRKMEILLHEVIHAIEEIYVLNLSEIAVKQLALGILSAVRDNKLDLLKEE
jgi:hypothetical protein